MLDAAACACGDGGNIEDEGAMTFFGGQKGDADEGQGRSI